MDERTHQWTFVGYLKTGRYGHGVIHDGSSFLVIGGNDNYKTEKCDLNGGVITCNEQQSPALDKYAGGALFLIADNYGDDC